MSRHGPQAGSIRPRLEGERLTSKQRRALVVIWKAVSVDDRQLKALIGPYSRNVIKSLEARGLTRGLTVGELVVWRLSNRGREIVAAVERFNAGAS